MYILTTLKIYMSQSTLGYTQLKERQAAAYLTTILLKPLVCIFLPEMKKTWLSLQSNLEKLCMKICDENEHKFVLHLACSCSGSLPLHSQCGFALRQFYFLTSLNTWFCSKVE